MATQNEEVDHDFMRDLIDELGEGWGYSTDPVKFRGARVFGPGKELLTLLFGWGPGGKLYIRGDFHLPEDYPMSGPTTYEINVSPSRGAKSVASDIRRRLLPQYVKQISIVARRTEQWEAENKAREAIAYRVASLTHTSYEPAASPTGRSTVRVYRDGNPVGVVAKFDIYSGTQANIELSNVPLNMIEAIAALIGTL